MEKIKTILDRQPLSSEYIRSKQDFGKVVSGLGAASTPIWKSAWFLGTVGVATVAIIVTAVTLTSSDTPDNPDKAPKQMIATNVDDSNAKDDEVQHQKTSSKDEEVQTPDVAEEQVASTPPPQVEIPDEPEPETPIVMTARTTDPEPEKTPELQVPNIAGVTDGPITFRDFCDPVGIQVGDGVLIYRYTIQYRSCARDVTARVSGNLIPREVCEEIRDCGNNIEVTFSRIEARDRHNNLIRLKDFSVVATL